MKLVEAALTGLLIVLLCCATGIAQDGQTEFKQSHELDTMVVTANRTQENLRNVSQNITIFTAKDIQRSGADSVTDLLKKVGIQVYSDGAASYGNEGVVIRGGRSSMHGFDIAGDILVLVDGHRTGSDFLGNVGLENTERIEVIRGPGAVQYGAAAMGGVINVITKRGGKDSKGFAEAGVGSWNEQRYKAGVSGKKGPLDLALSAAYYSRDDYELGNGEKYENSDVEDRIRYNLNAGWNLNDNNRLGLIVQGSDTNNAGKGEDAASSSTQNTAQSDFDNIGGFLLAKMYLLEKKNLTLSAGIRYDNFDVSVNAWKKNEDLRISREIDKNSLMPSLGIAYSPMDVLKLRANYARAFKMPLPRQLTGYTIMMSTPFVGNPDIEPEKSDNFDFGFDLDWNALFFSATWFYSDYQDMIGYETHNADAHYNGKHYWYYNVDSAEIQGIETGVRFNIAQYLGYNFQLEPYLYWTHLLVFEDDNGWNLPDRAKDSLSTGLVFASKESGLTASLDLSKF